MAAGGREAREGAGREDYNQSDGPAEMEYATEEHGEREVVGGEVPLDPPWPRPHVRHDAAMLMLQLALESRHYTAGWSPYTFGGCQDFKGLRAGTREWGQRNA